MQRFRPPETYSQYEGFIFDCDGTLVDTMPTHFEAWRRSLREGGGTFDFHWDLFVSRAGMSMEQTIVELGEQFGVAFDVPVVAARQREIYRDLSEHVDAVQEVVQFARDVAQEFPVAVASGSSHATVDRSLRGIGVLDLFPIVVTPEDVERGKPHPDMMLLAAEKMSVAPDKCLVIEDGELGFEAARRAGMDYLVVKCPPGRAP